MALLFFELGYDECDAPTTPELAAKELEALEAIKEDICKWLSNTVQMELDPKTLMDELDNGVILCKLASLIQQAAGEPNQLAKKPLVVIPMQPIKYSSKAEPNSFLARDNTSSFIEWCRKLGVEEAVIFESEGLVLHKDEKRVILCLLDVARFAERIGISPPQLVKMEREIEQLDYGATHDTVLPHNSHKDEHSKATPLQQSDHPSNKLSGLVKKILNVSNKCSCAVRRLEVKDCGSGKFIIRGGRVRSQKTLYARILRDHIMVRVGGGWDTLDHFLMVHDPCRVEKFLSLKQGPNDHIVQAHLQQK